MMGLLFSYYTESPFVFIEHFHLNGKEYGSIGIVIAGATLLGSVAVKRLIKLHTPIEIMHYRFILQLLSCLLLLLLMWLSPTNLNCWLGLTIFFLFTLMIEFGISSSTCIGQALIDYNDCLGTAGALFGMYYYFITAILIGFMSFLHNGHILTMPLYFTVLMSIATIFSWNIYHCERKIY